jgi:dihydrolipoamide dehydrogenase
MGAVQRFDAVVIGAGTGGRHAARGLVAEDLRVALVEDELVGGECPFWACIPTKTLLRPLEARGEAARVAGLHRPGLQWDAVADYRDYMVSGHDDSHKAAGLEKLGIAIVRGRGRLDGPGRVVVGDRVLQARRVVLAPGTTSAIPPIDGLDAIDYWTNREATALERVPESALVLGGGPVGVELGQMLARFGARTTVAGSHPRLLPNETAAVGELLAELLAEDGIAVRTGAKAERVEATGAGVRAHFDASDPVDAERLVVAVGRRPRTDDLGLDSVGIAPGEDGSIAVDARCRAAENVWAVGDVTGVALFTHVASYQARVAVRDMLGRPRDADYRAVPRVLFTDPEVATVGETPEQAAARGVAVATATGELSGLNRTETYGRDLRGGYGVVADREAGVPLGAWAVGPLASEWIHPMLVAIQARMPLDLLGESMGQFPTLAEAWSMAARELSSG